MARAGDVGTAALVREAAIALGATAHDPMELVMACRQLIERRPSSGPLVWLSARMITGSEARAEAWDAAEAIERDTTARELAHVLDADSTVLVIGAPEIAGRALLARGDVDVLVADTIGEGYGLVHQLEINDHSVADVPSGGVGAAAADADLVVLETDALSDGGALCRTGSLAAAAVAHHAGVPVWLVAGVGRCLPSRMWEPMVDRSISDQPWDDEVELVPLELVGKVIGPSGLQPVAEARLRVDCPIAPELFR
jgi:hypothetical protein